MTRLTRAANDFNNAHTINLRVRVCVRACARLTLALLLSLSPPLPGARDENFQLVMSGTWKLCWKLFHRYGTRRSVDERMKSPCLMASKNNERFQRYKLRT